MTSINLKTLPKRLADAERFALSYAPEALTGCWLWLGRPHGNNGYGRIKVGGAPMAAHRYSYELHRGAIPVGMLVLHQCDTPLCVNPGHLFLGTAQDNSDDKVAKSRQARGEALSAVRFTCAARGERNGNSKLDAEAVRQIRESSEAQRVIAKQFGVSQALVSKIQRGEMWK